MLSQTSRTLIALLALGLIPAAALSRSAAEAAPIDYTTCVRAGEAGVDWVVGDIDGDGHVNVFDIFIIAETWNKSLGDPGFNPEADLDCDGHINVFDIFVLAENWNS